MCCSEPGGSIPNERASVQRISGRRYRPPDPLDIAPPRGFWRRFWPQRSVHARLQRSFARNARRTIEILPKSEKSPLAQSRWKWAPTTAGEVVRDFWDALNRVIHAQRLEVGFEELPKQLAVIDGGAVVVPCVQAATDHKELAFIDPFALSHAYLYGAYPKLLATQQRHEVRH